MKQYRINPGTTSERVIQADFFKPEGDFFWFFKENGDFVSIAKMQFIDRIDLIS